MGAWFGPFVAFLSSVTWALGSTAYSRLSQAHSAYAVNFARALAALPLFLLAVFLFGDGFQDLAQLGWHHLGWLTLSMVCSYGLGDVLFLMSTRGLGVPGALALASCYPIWTAAAGFFFRGETLSAWQGAGLLLTLSGLAVVILNAPRSNDGRTKCRIQIRRGVILAIAASLFWSINSFSVAQASEVAVTPFAANALRMALALVLCPVIGAALSRTHRISLKLPVSAWKQYGWLFAFEGFGGSLCFVYGLAHSSIAVGATMTSLSPLVSVPFSIAFGLEHFSWKRLLGMVLSGVGLCLLLAGLDG